MTTNSFGAQSTLKVGSESFTIYKLGAIEAKCGAAARLPYSLKILLENLLRTEDGVNDLPVIGRLFQRQQHLLDCGEVLFALRDEDLQ